MKQIKNLALILLLPILVFANGETRKSYHALRLNGETITIDGKLTEDIWTSSLRGGSFTQRTPDDGKSPSFNTEFTIAYDDEYLYAGIRAFDDQPDQIQGLLTRRDEHSPSDWLYISLDSYNDNRTAFEFGLNAAGVKHDLRRFDDENMDTDWNAVWDGDVNIDDKGWTAEFRIPLRELRFTSSENMEWGLLVYREFPRNNNELSVWSYWTKSENGFVSKYGTLKGLKNIKADNPIYFTPYLVGQTNISDNLENSIHPDNYDLITNFGGDFRYSFENGLTLDATVNPDFGQVEADPAEFNLTEFESYFSEQRPFFIEGSNIMSFNLGFGDGDAGSSNLFYSRRIGRAPQGWFDSHDSTVYSESNNRSKIITAGKLTGKTENGLSIGILNAVTNEEISTEFLSDKTEIEHVVEPLTNYFLGRVQKDFREGQTILGGILTSTNRLLDGTDLESSMRENAYTGGLDFEHEFMDRNYGFYSSVAFSHVNGSKDAILSTQTNSARYFQRPDADHVSVDSSATSLSGFSTNIGFSKNKGAYRGATGIIASSPGFEVNDLGYMRSVDDISSFIWLSKRSLTAGKTFRYYQMNINQWITYDFSGLRKNLGGNTNGYAVLNNSWYFFWGLGYGLSGMNPSHLRGGESIYTPANTSSWFGFGSDERKKVAIQFFGNANKNADGVYGLGFSTELKLRPKNNIQCEIQPRFSYFHDTWSWVGQYDASDKSHFIFSDMNQKTFSLTFRTDYTLTNNLSVQFYAQPFITAGDYFTFREVSDAKAADFDDRFYTYDDEQIAENLTLNPGTEDEESWDYGVDMDKDGTYEHTFYNPDFNYKSLNTNMVVRWEFRPGSTLYFVWSTGKTDYESIGEFDLGANTKRLFEASGDNVFLVKLNYLLNW